MTRWHSIGAMLCMGLSFSVNELTRPRFEYAMGPSERVEVTGSLKLDVDGSPHAFDLATIQVVNGAAQRLWGGAQPVRELWLRSAELEAQSEPDLELFVDLSNIVPTIDGAARSLDPIVGRELPLLPAALASTLRSRLRLPGAQTHASMIQGTLTIQSVTALPSIQGGAAFRIAGNLALVLRDGSGTRSVAGSFEAPAIWY